MSYSAEEEDYRRMYLAYLADIRRGGSEPTPDDLLTFRRQYSCNRQKLSQTDEDRAFFLVVQAVDCIDKKLPYAATEKQAKKLTKQGERLLETALELDPFCPDALRIQASRKAEYTFEFLNYLLENKDKVRLLTKTRCHEGETYENPKQESLRADLHARPYLRWLFACVQNCFFSGRYRQCLDLGHELLRSDPDDSLGAINTMMLAYAQLEDGKGLARLLRKRPDAVSEHKANPWLTLARMALAYRRLDEDAARECLSELLHSCPNAPLILLRQGELPYSEFTRPNYASGSEDELVLAVSEASILLREGQDPEARGSLGGWVTREIAQELLRHGYSREDVERAVAGAVGDGFGGAFGDEFGVDYGGDR